jgi:hypothetical protein
MPSALAGMTGIQHHAWLFVLVEMGSPNYWPGLLRTMVLPISASQVAGITGVNHCVNLN